MALDYVCPVCNKIWKTLESDKTDELTMCCPEHHAERSKKIQEIEATYPSAESLGLLGSLGEPIGAYCHYPSSAGRRVIRKSEPMAG